MLTSLDVAKQKVGSLLCSRKVPDKANELITSVNKTKKYLDWLIFTSKREVFLITLIVTFIVINDFIQKNSELLGCRLQISIRKSYIKRKRERKNAKLC